MCVNITYSNRMMFIDIKPSKVYHDMLSVVVLCKCFLFPKFDFTDMYARYLRIAFFMGILSMHHMVGIEVIKDVKWNSKSVAGR